MKIEQRIILSFMFAIGLFSFGWGIAMIARSEDFVLGGIGSMAVGAYLLSVVLFLQTGDEC